MWPLWDWRAKSSAEVCSEYRLCTNTSFCLFVFILGVFCGFSINLPQRVEALQGSCVFIPCTFDIDQQFNSYLTDSAKRKWFKGVTPVFVSNSPDTGLFKGEIFGTATQKNCTTRFDNVNQNHNGSYYFRLEANGNLLYNYKEPTHSQVQIAISGECHTVHVASIMWLDSHFEKRNLLLYNSNAPSLLHIIYIILKYLTASLCVFQDLHPNPHWESLMISRRWWRRRRWWREVQWVCAALLRSSVRLVHHLSHGARLSMRTSQDGSIRTKLSSSLIWTSLFLTIITESLSPALQHTSNRSRSQHKSPVCYEFSVRQELYQNYTDLSSIISAVCHKVIAWMIFSSTRCSKKHIDEDKSSWFSSGGSFSDSELQQWCKPSSELHLVQRHWRTPESSSDRTKPDHQ